MKKIFLVIPLILSGCTTSAYESGWNGEQSYKIFHECAQSSTSKNIYIEQNVDRLVPMGLLTQQEADKAKSHLVSVGDKECLAYAAYGFKPSKYVFTFGPAPKKLLISRTVEYRCQESKISCPGQAFKIADGQVIAITPLQ